MLSDLGGAASVALVRMGDALGLYKTLHEKGSMTCEELANAANVNPRYLREWLSHQAASNYLTYDAASRKFTLPEEQAMVFAVEDSPVAMMGAFDGVVAWAEQQPKVQAAFQAGGGVAWGDHGPCLFCSTARFFRPGYIHNLVQNWLPTLDGVVAKLQNGAKVADVGCGHGWSTVIMARAFPQSEFVGYDFHPGSIEQAQAHAREHNLTNVRFQVGTAKDYPETGLDFVTFFDCLHDMGDPAGAAAHVKQSLKPDGTWMIVEPMAADRLEDNMNPIGRIYYAASTMVCVPTSLAQEVGAALGAQAGEAKLREVISAEDLAISDGLPKRPSIWSWKHAPSQSMTPMAAAGLVNVGRTHRKQHNVINTTARLLNAVETIRPILLEDTKKAEAERVPTSTAYQAMYNAGLFAMLAPRRYGGFELHPADCMRVWEAVARIDASAAWNLVMNQGIANYAAWLPEAGVKELFSNGIPTIAGALHPPAHARRVEGGWRVTGQVPFGSGCHCAQWLAMPALEEGAEAPFAVFFPRKSGTILDTWHTMGMRGTGSTDYRADDLFVPNHMTAPVGPLTKPAPGLTAPYSICGPWRISSVKE